MMKRSGRAHDSCGVGGTAQGELTIDCPVCPRPGINLPNGWDAVDIAKASVDLLPFCRQAAD